MSEVWNTEMYVENFGNDGRKNGLLGYVISIQPSNVCMSIIFKCPFWKYLNLPKNKNYAYIWNLFIFFYDNLWKEITHVPNQSKYI